MAKPSERLRRLAISLLAVASASCDPYQRFGQDDDSVGPVDPVNFPPANLGFRGDRTRAGVGTFTATPAFAGGTEASYFPYPTPALPPMADPLAVASLTAPVAYAFDQRCQAPAGYAWDTEHQQSDEVRLDQQGSIFTALPRATYTVGAVATSTYAPVVRRVPVSALDQPCQKLKSEGAVKEAMLNTTPDGKLMAWLIIDPAAGVYPTGRSPANHPGLGLQRWGWFNRYLLAYLDGGEVPVGDDTVTDAMGTKTVTRLRTQKLYYPRSMVAMTRMNPDGTMTTTNMPGRIGAGWDVLEARPGEPGHSPLCQVLTYDTVVPREPAALPRDTRVVEQMFPKETLLPASPPYVYCLQPQVIP
jgi:hypothetical protein